MENITYFTGQCGSQMGSAIWELLCGEHGIAPDGQLVDPNEPEDVNSSYKNYFYLSATGQYVPRCVFSDLECTVIDEIRMGHYRNLFHPNCLLSGREDAANIFARGYWSMGSQKIDGFKEVIRQQVELCDHCSSIISVHSSGGGSGSGYNALQQDELQEEYPKLSKIECVMFPSGMFSTNMVEAYNSLLAAHYCMGITDITFTYDNDALYNVVEMYLKVPNPTYADINRITSQVFSALTACDRFGGPVRSNLTDYQTNLVPYPRIHFPTTSYSPILCPFLADHENKQLFNMTRSLFTNNMQFCSLDVEKGKYVSCCLLYRGTVSPSDVFACMNRLKCDKIVNFVDWCPTGMKVSMCDMPPAVVRDSKLAYSSNSVSLISNTSAISTAFHCLLNKFNHLYSKRAFVHWYVGDGMEEGEFNDAKDNINVLIEDYDACYSADGVLEDRGMFVKTDKRHSKKAQSDSITESENGMENVNVPRKTNFSSRIEEEIEDDEGGDELEGEGEEPKDEELEEKKPGEEQDEAEEPAQQSEVEVEENAAESEAE